MSKNETRKPTHVLLPERLASAVKLIRDLTGDLEKANEYANAVVAFKLLISLLKEAVIPKKHLPEVIKSLNDIRTIAIGAILDSVLRVLDDTVDELEES